MTTSTKLPVILVIEFEAGVSLETADVLTEAGYRVIAGTNADHALALLGVCSNSRVLFINVAAPDKNR